MHSRSIYIGLLGFIISVLIALPVIKIPVSTSPSGIVRSAKENTGISAVVSGRVIKNYLEKNNQNISKGDYAEC
ncbi:hypothetical protein ACFFUE_08555 [Bergeyella porcorum]|uniref:hypothetical protein n=1 Tax=Bergeyella porcorum TaxID=1735111 RepID=UPI0035E73F6F